MVTYADLIQIGMFFCWHYQPVFTGQKEVTAGTLTSTTVTSLNCKG